MKYIFRWITLVLVLAVLAVPSSVRADVAPPSHPPGSNPGPDTEGTQVRMMAETVLLEILPNADVDSLGKAKVSADFTMRNLGNETESMGVRFPISSNNGFGQYPELENIAVKVNGKSVSTKRVMESDPMWGSDPVPWSQFDVTFPPNQDVQIQVSYVLSGTGEYPFVAYYYILHTGEGWNDTIGSADLIVRLPYEANAFNVIFNEEVGWSYTTLGGVISGNEIKWHFDDLEPDTGNDFQLSIVNPVIWRKALNEQSNLKKDPNDGEAWGRLGKLYKEMFFFRRGFRQDAGGQQLYQLSVEAYEKSVSLLPDDALWHAGFADLLAVHAYYESWEGKDATTEMLRSMQEIDRALQLSPNDAKVKEIAEKIYWLFPDAVMLFENGYDFLWLTVTPIIETPTSVPALPTETLQATPEPVSTAAAVPTREAAPNPTTTPPTGRNPLCGSAALAPLALIWFTRRKNHS
jgi:hypothetical protein